MPVGYGDNPPVGTGPPEPKPRPDAGKAQKPSGELPAAGPHDDPALTNADATPGTGALPEPGADRGTDSTSG